MLDQLAFLYDISDMPVWGLIWLVTGSAFCVIAWLAWLWANRLGHRTGAGDDSAGDDSAGDDRSGN